MDKISKALRHENILGAGARAREKYLHIPEDKIEVVMKEFKRGTLHSGSGDIVKSHKQAMAIALSESRKARLK